MTLREGESKGNRGQVLLEEYHKGPGGWVGWNQLFGKLKQLKNGGWMPANVIVSLELTNIYINFLQRWLGR